MGLHSKLNQELIEEFGRLEQLCNQIYGENHGVTSYIEDMDNLSVNARYKVVNWDYYHKRLKEVRHKRNMLSHGEVSFCENYAEPEDIEFGSDFYTLIMNSTDPISLHRKSTRSAAPAPKKSSYNTTSDFGEYRSEEYQKKSCLSEMMIFFITLGIAAGILALLIFGLTAYFK